MINPGPPLWYKVIIPSKPDLCYHHQCPDSYGLNRPVTHTSSKTIKLSAQWKLPHEFSSWNDQVGRCGILKGSNPLLNVRNLMLPNGHPESWQDFSPRSSQWSPMATPWCQPSYFHSSPSLPKPDPRYRKVRSCGYINTNIYRGYPRPTNSGKWRFIRGPS